MGLLNGWTKSQVKKVVDTMFIGKAYNNSGQCSYLGCGNSKCGVGLFIPDGHEAQLSSRSAFCLTSEFPELANMMPLNPHNLEALQRFHDHNARFSNANLSMQREMLLDKILHLAEREGE